MLEYAVGNRLQDLENNNKICVPRGRSFVPSKLSVASSLISIKSLLVCLIGSELARLID
jgi:hypothetical protein